MEQKLPILLIVAALSLTACEPGEVTLVQPEDPAGADRRTDVHVTLSDSSLAEALGWEAGVPGAVSEWAFVHQLRYLFRGVVSDTSGMIRFEPDGRGWHWVAARKEVEIGGKRRVVGGGVKTTASEDASTDLFLDLDNPGTLVISEIYMDHPPPWETGGTGYQQSKYIELYNNSMEVVYLDGLILGKAYDFWRDLSLNGHHPCAYTRPFREDRERLWSRTHWRFPGSGTDHPIPPGEAVVVAVVAADHSEVHASMFDLSDADFQFAGGGAAENPAAPSLENVSSDYGYSSEFYISNAFWFLSDPVELATLPVMSDGPWRDGSYIDYRGFPADAILDAVVIWWDTTSDPVIDRRFPPCEHPIHPRFDALPGGYQNGSARPEDLLVAPQRSVVRTQEGRSILQDTNTSAVDFENLARTPGWIP